jgi:hypothetical protein
MTGLFFLCNTSYLELQTSYETIYQFLSKEVPCEFLQRKQILVRPKSCRLLEVITKYNPVRSVSLRLLHYTTLSQFSVMYVRGNPRKVLVYFDESDNWKCPCIRHSISHSESSRVSSFRALVKRY